MGAIAQSLRQSKRPAAGSPAILRASQPAIIIHCTIDSDAERFGFGLGPGAGEPRDRRLAGQTLEHRSGWRRGVNRNGGGRFGAVAGGVRHIHCDFMFAFAERPGQIQREAARFAGAVQALEAAQAIAAAIDIDIELVGAVLGPAAGDLRDRLAAELVHDHGHCRAQSIDHEAAAGRRGIAGRIGGRHGQLVAAFGDWLAEIERPGAGDNIAGQRFRRAKLMGAAVEIDGQRGGLGGRPVAGEFGQRCSHDCGQGGKTGCGGHDAVYGHRAGDHRAVAGGIFGDHIDGVHAIGQRRGQGQFPLAGLRSQAAEGAEIIGGLVDFHGQRAGIALGPLAGEMAGIAALDRHRFEHWRCWRFGIDDDRALDRGRFGDIAGQISDLGGEIVAARPQRLGEGQGPGALAIAGQGRVLALDIAGGAILAGDRDGQVLGLGLRPLAGNRLGRQRRCHRQECRRRRGDGIE